MSTDGAARTPTRLGTWVAVSPADMMGGLGWWWRAVRFTGSLVGAAILYIALTGTALAHEDDAVERMRRDANEALLRGQFEKARVEFEQLLKMVPNDASAQRDAARAAQAAGEFEYSAEALERAHHFEKHTADPELHYLRGEALYTLNRPSEARREHRIAELEIGSHPTDRMQKLWLARVYARRGWLVLADRLYDPMWPPAPQKDSEVAFNQADGHLMNKDWEGGARVLRRYLELEPKSIRAREMLAWALEAKGDLDGELVVRRSLAVDDPTAANRRDYGRALERAASFSAARDEYAGAIAAGGKDPDGTLATSYERMRYRTTPELAGGGQFRSDPQAWSWRAQAGAALPFGTRHQLSLMAWHDSSTDWTANLPNSAGSSTLRGTGNVTGIGASLLAGTRSGASLLLGADGRYSSSIAQDNHDVVYRQAHGLTAGGFAEGDAPLFGVAQVNLHADYNEEWADAPITIHEGGAMTGVTGHLFLFPSDRRLLVDTGAQVRRLTIDPQDAGGVRPQASQRLLFGGVDFNLWATPTRVVRGEALDERLARRTYLADAGVLAYRHYELFTDQDPQFRIALAPRASIDLALLAFRKATAGGRFGVDVHGGGGYDNQRQRVLIQGGGALVLAASWSSRMLLSYDMSRESYTGIPGTLHIAWLTYHADL